MEMVIDSLRYYCNTEHILNTILATSRRIIAIVEQYQQKDGSVIIPEVLRACMNGIKELGQ